MTSSLSRGVRTMAVMVPLLSEAGIMGRDADKRERVGRHLRAACDTLGGAFPWLVTLISDVPAIGGSALARGARPDSESACGGPFFTCQPLQSNEGVWEISPKSSHDQIETDLQLMRMALPVVQPFLGSLSSELASAALGILCEQVRAESSLAEELSQRSSLSGRLPEVVFTELSCTDGTRWVEQVPANLASSLDRSRAALGTFVHVWHECVVNLGVALPDASWHNWRLLEEVKGHVLVRRAGGAATVPPPQREFVAQAAHAIEPSDMLTGPLLQVLSDELGVDGRKLEWIAHRIAALIFGDKEPSLGVRWHLRQLERVTKDSQRQAALSRSFFVILRQLGVFRGMADQLGLNGSFFKAGDQR